MDWKSVKIKDFGHFMIDYTNMNLFKKLPDDCFYQKSYHQECELWENGKNFRCLFLLMTNGKKIALKRG